MGMAAEDMKPMDSESAEKRYKILILDMWESIRLLETKILTQYLFIAPLLDSGMTPQNITVNEAELSSVNELLSLSITLWRELLPKIKGNANIEKEFMSYQQYNDEPLSYTKDLSLIFKFTQTLRDTLEALGVTKFEREVS